MMRFVVRNCEVIFPAKHILLFSIRETARSKELTAVWLFWNSYFSIFQQGTSHIHHNSRSRAI